MILALAALAALFAPQTPSGPVTPSLQRAIEQALYGVASEEPGRVELSNPAQRMGGCFEAGALELAAGDVRFTLELDSWGRPDGLVAAGAARLHLDPDDARRFEARRGGITGGGITEWYLNEPRGLEQGFTIAERPQGAGPLWIVQRPEGEVTVRVEEGGRDAVFEPLEPLEPLEPAGSVRYAGLRAWDASGHDLPARMRTSDGRLILEVDDERAEYPVQVDPWFVQTLATLARPKTEFGWDASVSGDTAAVGSARFSLGNVVSRAVHVFRRSAGGSWEEVRRLTSEDEPTHALVGAGLSLDGDRLAMGVNSVGWLLDGYVSVRERNQGGPEQWGEVARIDPVGEDGAFGNDVALDGDRLAILNNDTYDAQVHERDAGGANAWGLVAQLGITGQSIPLNQARGLDLSGDTLALTNYGIVQLYERDPGGTWQQGATLDGASIMGCQLGTNNCFFNSFVSLDGDTLMVGNYKLLVAPHGAAGGIFVFERDLGGPDAWGLATLLTASDPQSGAYFGYTVAHCGDYALVGAPSANVSTGEEAGVCYLFGRDTGGPGAWGQVARIEAPEPSDGDFFGVPLVATQDRFLTCSDRYDELGVGWIIDVGSGGVIAMERFTPGQHDPDAGFGHSVAVQGDTAVVGAWAQSSVGSAHEGAAYVFERDLLGPESWAFVKELVANPPVQSGSFGDAVAIDGDRIVVGAARDDHPMALGAGAAYVFERNVGGAENWGERAKLVASDPGFFDYFGDAVAVDGDTVVVGATQSGGNGAAYVFEPDPLFGTIWSQTAKLTGDGGVADQFGHAVALDGDTVLVGSPLDDDVGTDGGAAYLFERDLGGPDAWGRAAKLTASDGASSDQFGFSTAVRGDLALVGSPQRESSVLFPDQGGAYTFERDLGGPGAWGEGASMSVSEAGARLGTSVALGDDTVLIGAPGKDHPARDDAGAVYIYTPSPVLAHAWAQQVETHAADPATSQQFGASLSFDDGIAVVGGTDESISTTALPNTAEVIQALPPNVTNYCAAGVSASGCQAILGGFGVPSATQPSGFTVTATSVEGAKDGLYFFGSNGRQANPWGNGSSLQCVVPPVARAGLLTGTGTAGVCDGSFAQDLNGVWCQACPKAGQNPGAGTTVQLQLWYRDPLNTSNQTTSLSDAIEFVIQP